MARRFFIGKTTSVSGKVLFIILKKTSENTLTEPFKETEGGEPDFKKISKLLLQIFELERNYRNPSITAFSVSNLCSETILVNADSSLIFIEPVDHAEMKLFYNTYFTTGRYVK